MEQIKCQKELEKYFEYYNNSPDMYVSVDYIDSLIEDCNKTLLIKTGYSREELIGQHIFFIYHPDCMQKVKKTFKMFSETGYIENHELELKRKDGSKIPVLLSVTPIKNENGKTIYSNSIWRDISNIKKLEDKLKVANQNLENKVAELEELSYITAHYLNDPVLNIQRELKTLDHNSNITLSGRPILKKALKYLGDIGEKLYILNSILAVNVDLGRDKREVYFSDIFQKVKSDMSRVIFDANMVIKADFSQCPQIEYSPMQLNNLLRNLITTAIKNKPPNKYPVVEISTKRNDDQVILIVKDNGIGFESEKNGNKTYGLLKKVTNQNNGIGIGLYVVKTIVNKNGGNMTVYSDPDKGSTLKLCL